MLEHNPDKAEKIAQAEVKAKAEMKARIGSAEDKAATLKAYRKQAEAAIGTKLARELDVIRNRK
jgi:hypothetical protein